MMESDFFVGFLCQIVLVSVGTKFILLGTATVLWFWGFYEINIDNTLMF